MLRQIRLIVAEWLLGKAQDIAPAGSDEEAEIAAFLLAYIVRRQVARAEAMKP